MSAKTVAWIETSELERLHEQPLSAVRIYCTEQIARLGEPYPGENLVLRSDWEAEHTRAEQLAAELAKFIGPTEAQVDGMTHDQIIDALRDRGDPLSFDAANAMVYLTSQDGLLEKAQEAAEKAHAELAEHKRPLDAQMARLNERVIALTAESFDATTRAERAEAALRELVAIHNMIESGPAGTDWRAELARSDAAWAAARAIVEGAC